MQDKPPRPRTCDHVERRHGVAVRDPWFWMRDDRRRDPEVLDHLRQENAFVDAWMAPLAPLRTRLFEEMVGRVRQTDQSVPAPLGDWEYYERTEEGKQYPMHCRRPADGLGPEQVLLDENRLAGEGSYLHVGAIRRSPDQKRMAYAVDRDGGEIYAIQVLELDSGETLPDRIPAAYNSLQWAADGRTLFYTTLDESHRPHRVWRHELGADPREDVLVFEEPDPSFFVRIDRTRDRRFLVVQLDSSVTSEAHLLSADRPREPLLPVVARQQGVEYSVEHWNGLLLMLTNDQAQNFKLLAAPFEDGEIGDWTESIPHDPDTMLEAVEPFRDHLVVTERRHGVRGVRVCDLPSWTSHSIRFDEEVRVVEPFDNLRFDTSVVRLAYESLTMPESTFDYDMATRRLELRKTREVLGGYDPGLYRSERLLATAPDGTQVPMSLVYRSDLRRDGSAPALLYGYGAYGHTIEPRFDPDRVSLLDRGFVYAIAHVRGGGALGRAWYESGKLEHKHHTFDDFIACAERLIADGYTGPRRLAIRGGSAGGLLVGAVVNRRPELFRAAVAKVPFVDVLNTMLDETIPLTVIEWEEWGDPREPEAYSTMAAYSPYDNVTATRYPDLLITAGLTDPRVAYWEPAKWAARLRATADPAGLVLLKTDLEAGHGGVSGRYERWQELAFEFAFLLDRLGVERRPAVGDQAPVAGA